VTAAETATTLARMAARRRDEMVGELKTLVEHESPTGDVGRLDTLAEVVERRWLDVGAIATRHGGAGTGAHLELQWHGPDGTPHDAAPALLIGHYDTVHDVGTLRRNP
jgi:glutamate carboxypeptidase